VKISAQLPPKAIAKFNTPDEFTLGYQPNSVVIARVVGGGQRRKGLLLSLRGEKNLKSVNIRQSYKQERGCLMHFSRLANTLLKDLESARDNRVLDCNFAKYLPI